MKHSFYDLKQMQSLPLESKIIMSQRRIRDWYDYWSGEVYVSFSGGKDSTVLKHLVENTTGVYDVPNVFVNTGLEYPEVRMFATSQSNVTVLKPKLRFDEVIKRYGYPVISKEVAQAVDCAKKCQPWAIKKLQGLDKNGVPDKARQSFRKYDYLVDSPFKISNQCCTVMKKNPVKKYEKETGRKPILGTMAQESYLRQSEWMKNGCNAFQNKRPTSQPMSFWTEQDVLEYIVKFNLSYASVYGEIKRGEDGRYYTTGCDRTGCMFCMFGISQDGCPNRFQRMKETHPRQYDYCMNKLGLKEVLDYIGVDYE